MDIGNKIKELRIQKNLTQEELADRAELTKGFISQVERNHTSPSIATLVDILQCLGTDLKHFFSDDEDRQVVFKKEDFFEKIDEDLKHRITWIVPNAQKNEMEPILLELQPGGSSYEHPPFEGEVFGYVLKGNVKLTIGEKQFKVKRGEAFYYPANNSYSLKSERGAQVLWISSPPAF
ncbi:MAG: helix-turn-helix domain-containing protein [Eubacterium sp.]|nr:helix-turn-helix domain-containing protein [Eubacterium sp.]